MIEKIQFLPPHRQRWVRIVALSMEGPAYPSRDSIGGPLFALGAIIYALFGIFG